MIDMLILYICLLVIIYMNYTLVMLWQGQPMYICMCLYSEFTMKPLLYDHTDWDDMTHHKT